MCPLLLHLASVLASPYVLEVGEAVNLGIAGDEPHIFPRADGGWWLAYGAGGDANVAPFDLSWNQQAEAVALTGRGDLISHSLAMCPDGTFIHTGAGTISVLADSAWGYRYDAEWNAVAAGTIHEEATWMVHKNSPIVCAGWYQGSGFSTPDTGNCQAFATLDAGGNLGELWPLGPPMDIGTPRFEGGGLMWEEETETLLLLEKSRWSRYRPGDYEGAMNPYDWGTLEDHATNGDGARGSLARLENCYLDVYTDKWGSVWLNVRENPLLATVELTEITTGSSSDAYVTVEDGLVLITWAQDGWIHVSEIGLDAEACAALPAPVLPSPGTEEPGPPPECPAFPGDEPTDTDTGTPPDEDTGDAITDSGDTLPGDATTAQPEPPVDDDPGANVEGDKQVEEPEEGLCGVAAGTMSLQVPLVALALVSLRRSAPRSPRRLPPLGRPAPRR